MKTGPIILFFIVSFIVHASEGICQDSIKYSERPNGHNAPYRIPINELLKSPDVYQGTPIEVVGYMNLDWEADAIYISKADFQSHKYKKGLWLHINQFKFIQASKYNRHYVIIEAVFDANDYGHENLWGGALKEVKSLRLYHWPQNR